MILDILVIIWILLWPLNCVLVTYYSSLRGDWTQAIIAWFGVLPWGPIATISLVFVIIDLIKNPRSEYSKYKWQLSGGNAPLPSQMSKVDRQVWAKKMTKKTKKEY